MSLSASYQIQMNREHSAHLPPQRQWHLLIPQWRNAILNIFEWFFFSKPRCSSLSRSYAHNFWEYADVCDNNYVLIWL